MPDQADADRHLGSGAGARVAVARDGEEAVAALVGGEQDRVREVEEVLERTQRRRGGVGVAVGEREPPRQLVERADQVALGPRRGAGRRRRAPPRSARRGRCRPRAGGTRRPCRSATRSPPARSASLRTRDRRSRCGRGAGRADRPRRFPGSTRRDLRDRVGVEVRAGLVEELARERDALGVDVLDDRHIGDVRRAVGRAGRKRRRDHARQAGADRLERDGPRLTAGSRPQARGSGGRARARRPSRRRPRRG